MSSEAKWDLNPIKFIDFLIVCVMVLTVLLTASAVLRDLPSESLKNLAIAKIFDAKPPNATVYEEHVSHRQVIVQKDKLLGGLLPSGIDQTSCLSRHESVLYHKELRHKPSSYLISKLRNYEALHKQCGPHTELYNRSVELIKSGHYRSGSADCNYLVWISYSGLGNRMLTLASAFLYALLNNRVLLVDPGANMPGLFCEPFPETSWLIPKDFPLINQFNTFDQKSPNYYGYMLKNNIIGNTSIQPPFIYLHLAHDYDDQDKLFFCDQNQIFLQKSPLLLMKTDNYFVPFLFLIPTFEQELSNLFPEKETVLYFLGRYLFHPTNSVWGLVKRYYQAYLAQADEKLGIQIRVLETNAGPFKYVFDQIVDCTMKENLLPQINRSSEPIVLNQSGKQKNIAVLITSLSSGYSEEFQKMYWENPTVIGEIVSFYQPSQEEYQQSKNLMHERKALAEMYLLSLSDKLVTSGWSTFGYVAQGLGGLKPWILYKANQNRTAHNPPCVRAASLEPSFHAPPYYDCKMKTSTDTSKIVPHVRHCEDVS
ncbi:galactoside 2-alpha-L-fucosyltransferase-like [Lycium barbarum]|uniref:galactoside 2-alpha-L-fucosyltransferase-like n=1 Tax=Lycium barbarum TaxID=112863 RepID=UPI00293F6DF8|nr:galactoside 2-alpha-L-fucosyltransferase-like [Lycium barbarum]